MSELCELLAANKRIVISDTKSDFTGEQLSLEVDRVAEQLKVLKVKNVGIYLDNGINWVAVDLACQKLGVCITPLPTFFSTLQLEYVINLAGIDVILTEPDLLIELKKASFSSEFKKEQNFLPGLLSLEVNHEKSDQSLLPYGTQKITFTSGSTGQPKGVCLNVVQQTAQAKALALAVDIKHVKHLCALPLTTLLENIAGVYAPLFSEGKIIVPSLQELGFKGSSLVNPESFLMQISLHQPNSLILIPQLLQLLIEGIKKGWQVPGSLKFIAVGGARVSTAILEESKKLGLPVFEGYGLSENASVVSLNTRKNKKIATTGLPLPHLKVRVVEDELVVSGNTMLGYANLPDSWNQNEIATGDLAEIDENGFIKIKGRKKNTLISSYGRNINPEWPESEVLANSNISECVVFGDDRAFCVALITPRSEEFSDQDIQAHLNDVNSRLPDYAQIMAWFSPPSSLAQVEGLLTENMRPRREKIITHFKEKIDSLYK